MNPATRAFVISTMLLAICATTASAAAQDTTQSAPRVWGAYFVDKDGKWVPVEEKSVKDEASDAKWATVSYPPYEGAKIRVAFTHEEQGGGAKVIAGADLLLMKALKATGRFMVLGTPTATPPPAFLISVSMQDAGSKDTHHGLGPLSTHSRKSKIALTYTLTDPNTSEVLLVETVNGSSSSGGVGVAYMGASTSSDGDPSLQAAINSCVNKATYLIALRHVE
jgi:curli biogenesis system outer membrane secretion channel CsgG